MTDFIQNAEQTINHIADTIEDLDTEGRIDVDLNDSILTLETDDGTFVINKQNAVREVWLSSPITGPYHFSFTKGRWTNKMGKDLFQILTEELNIDIQYEQ